MRTDRFADPTGSADGSLSRRAFVLAAGSATGTVVGSGLASAGEGGDGWSVGATAPYLAAVREAAASVVDVVAAPARDLDDPPDLPVSGRPGSNEDALAVADVLVDGWAALSNPEGTWRDALRPAEVRERRGADAAVEAWSEVAGDGPGTVESVERPDARKGTTALVRGTRAYQYARGRGGVGYYDVDGSAIADLGGEALGDGGDAVPIVRLAYVHAQRASRPDDRLAGFLEVYAGSRVGTGGTGAAFVDPTVVE